MKWALPGQCWGFFLMTVDSGLRKVKEMFFGKPKLFLGGEKLIQPNNINLI